MNTLICAIEFGTSRISAIIAQRDENGHATIRAIENEPANGCVHHGYIYNVEEAAAKVKGLMQKLANRLSSDKLIIGKAYVGLAGMSIHSMPHDVTIHLGEETEITDEILQSLRQKSFEVPLDGYDLYEVEAMYYHVDGRLCQNPKGARATEITAFNQLIIGRTFIRRNAKETMERAGLEIAGFMVLPLTTGDILSDVEKQQGCVLVNFGAGTTTVAIYKNTLRHLAVIPIGGDAITYDIMSAGLKREKAEEVKTSWASAFSNSGGDFYTSSYSAANAGIEISQLNRIVQFRYEEIIANVRRQIEISGIKEEINGGWVLTGGATAQRGLYTLISQQFFVGVKGRPYLAITGNGEEKRTRYAALLSMAARATEDCRKAIPSPNDTDKAGQGGDTPSDPGVKPLIGEKNHSKTGGTRRHNIFGILKDSLFGSEDF